MPEPEVQQVETPPVETPPPPPVEAVDASGVPYKNRAAEWERKAREAEEDRERYRVELGRRAAEEQARAAAQPKPASTIEQLKAKYDPEQLAAIQQIAREIAREEAQNTGHQFVTRASIETELQDKELFTEAQQQYAQVNQNPMWARVDEVLRQQHAIEKAKAVIRERKLQAASKGAGDTALEEARRAQAAGAGLPSGGTPMGGGTPSGNKREDYIKQFKGNEENLMWHRKICRDMRIDVNSKEGQDLLNGAAEEAFNTPLAQMYGGKTKAALDVLRKELAR